MKDAIEKAVKAIWADMTDRRGIKWELTGCEPEIQEEIRNVWRKQMRAIDREATERECERCAVRIDAMVRLCAPTERAAATVLREVAAAIRAETKGGR